MRKSDMEISVQFGGLSFLKLEQVKHIFQKQKFTNGIFFNTLRRMYK